MYNFFSKKTPTDKDHQVCREVKKLIDSRPEIDSYAKELLADGNAKNSRELNVFYDNLVEYKSLLEHNDKLNKNNTNNTETQNTNQQQNQNQNQQDSNVGENNNSANNQNLSGDVKDNAPNPPIRKTNTTTNPGNNNVHTGNPILSEPVMERDYNTQQLNSGESQNSGADANQNQNQGQDQNQQQQQQQFQQETGDTTEPPVNGETINPSTLPPKKIFGDPFKREINSATSSETGDNIGYNSQSTSGDNSGYAPGSGGDNSNSNAGGDPNNNNNGQGDNMKDMDPEQKRKAVKATAELVMDAYCMHVPKPFKHFGKFNEYKWDKMVFEGILNPNIEVEPGVTAESFKNHRNQQVDEIFTVTPEVRKSIQEPLEEVLMQRNIMLTPEQRLMGAILMHVGSMAFASFQLSRENKEMLSAFKERTTIIRESGTNQQHYNHSQSANEQQQQYNNQNTQNQNNNSGSTVHHSQPVDTSENASKDDDLANYLSKGRRTTIAGENNSGESMNKQKIERGAPEYKPSSEDKKLAEQVIGTFNQDNNTNG